MEAKQIKELVETLHKHKEDYCEGKTQDFAKILCDCEMAANVILQFLEHSEPEQNVRALKECIVRLAMKNTGIAVE